jgi:hypothetical protein
LAGKSNFGTKNLSNNEKNIEKIRTFVSSIGRIIHPWLRKRDREDEGKNEGLLSLTPVMLAMGKVQSVPLVLFQNIFQ